MKWITAADLARWGEGIPARTDLPGLVGDLIRGTAPDIAAFRFPSGDKGQVRGFDGYLETVDGSTFIPAGRSIWEFGASRAQAGKFAKDIKSRTDQISPDERAETTFVFVTPQTWDNSRLKLEDAVKPYRDKCGWKNVRYIDGPQLETWLDEAPAVAATHARLTLRTRPQIGARSCEEFWDGYSSQFEVDLTEEVLLCERDEQRHKLLDHLQGTGGTLKLTADSPDEVVAFAVAAIRKAPPEVRLFLEARTLIVETEEAALQLRTSEHLIFLVRDKARPSAGMLSRAGPTLVGLGYDQKRGNDDFLGNPSTFGMAKALETMEGVDEQQAAVLARKAGRSVTILARTIPRGAPEKPTWVDSGGVILPAMLAGGWQALSDDDRRFVAMLTADGDYGRLEAALRPLSRIVDAPIDLIGSVWQMRAPVDAFVHLGHLITQADLDRIGAVTGEIFGTMVPEQDDEAVSFVRERPPGASSWLRNGVATTLLHIAVLPDQANFSVAGVNPQGFVDGLIKSLPDLKSDTRLLASIRDQLPVLMEAAPDPLLEALEQLLGGDKDVAQIITVREGTFAPSRPLTEVLWALEMLAWDPAYLERVAMLLARLAELDDTPTRLSNRPINSLQTIFTAWLPSTNARLPQRLAVLEAIVREHEQVGWDLFVSLLPDLHGVTSLTSKPRYREAGASERETLTVGMVRETYDHLISRVIDLAGHHVARWAKLITQFSNFPPDLRQKFYDRLTEILAAMTDPDREQTWKTLRDQVARHRSFSDAAWALPAAELDSLDALLKEHEPTGTLQRQRWLFDDWFPDMPGEFDERERQIEEARNAAVLSMFEQGYGTIVEAVAEVKLPHILGSAAANVLDLDTIERLSVDTLGVPEEQRSFVIALSAVAQQRYGADWEERVRSLYSRWQWSDCEFAALVLGWPDAPSTWDFVAALSSDLDKEYWLRKQPSRLRGERDAVIERAVGKYLELGRPGAALSVVSDRFDQTEPQTLFRILDTLPDELASSKPVDQLLGYMVEKALDALSTRQDVEVTELAKREYLYLELLRFRKKSLGIHRLMATDAAFYFSIISAVFKARSDDSAEDPSPEERARAKSGYTLLSEFHAVPGLDGATVNYEELRSWVDEVRRLAAENDRVEITDDFIGRILAHSPVDDEDQLWPHCAVRRVIEELRSKELEEGFAVEKYNSRGVVTKAIFEGGKQERGIAANFRDLARKITSPRTSALLHRMADHYDDYADREDLRAEQDKAARH